MGWGYEYRNIHLSLSHQHCLSSWNRTTSLGGIGLQIEARARMADISVASKMRLMMCYGWQIRSHNPIRLNVCLPFARCLPQQELAIRPLLQVTGDCSLDHLSLSSSPCLVVHCNQLTHYWFKHRPLFNKHPISIYLPKRSRSMSSFEIYIYANLQRQQ